MEKYGYIFPYGYFMRMGVDSLIGLRWHGRFYTCVICQVHQKGVVKLIVGTWISIIGRVITIWENIIIETQSDFWWTGKKEEGIIGVYSPHWDTYWRVCRSSWGPGKCCLWVIYLWEVHIILVSLSNVWGSKCHQFSYNVHLLMVYP